MGKSGVYIQLAGNAHFTQSEGALGLQHLVTDSIVPVQAIAFIRKMTSSSSALLVRCDDGLHYVLKMAGDKRRPCLLANELFGGVLAASAGLPVTRTKFVHVSASFLATLPETVFSAEKGEYFPSPGFHLGSRFIGDVTGPGRPLQHLTQAQLKRLSDKQIFVGMYLFDKWAQQCSSRKVLFLSYGAASQYIPVFFNHGGLLGGANWNVPSCEAVTQPFGLTCASLDKGLQSMSSWICAFQRAFSVVLPPLFAAVPDQWYSGDLGAVREILRRRLEDLPSLVEAEWQRLVSSKR